MAQRCAELSLSDPKAPAAPTRDTTTGKAPAPDQDKGPTEEGADAAIAYQQSAQRSASDEGASA